VEEVLKLLEQDARRTPAQIAELTGKPESKVLEIIAEAERKRIIVRYKTMVNWEKAGVEKLYAFIEVKVTPERGMGFDSIAERLLGFPEVHSLYLLSGAYDLHVVVEGEHMKEIAFFVAEKLAPLEGVLSTATHFVLKQYKVNGEVLEHQEEARRLPVTP